MTEPSPAEKKRNDAIMSVLVGWSELSRGDISIICAVLRNRGGGILTTAGSAHAAFWQGMVSIGFAEKLDSPIDPEGELVESLAFQLTDDGLFNLPMFLIHYDLLNMGACTPIVDRPSSSPEVAPRPSLGMATLAIIAVFCALSLFAVTRGLSYWSSAFFLLTYAGVIAAALRPTKTPSLLERSVRGVVVLNAIFVGISFFGILTNP